MNKGDMIFWMSEYNYDNNCFTVVEVNNDIKEYTLMRVRAGEKPDFTDFWRISFKYYERNKEILIPFETEDEYWELVDKREEMFPNVN